MHINETLLATLRTAAPCWTALGFTYAPEYYETLGLTPPKKKEKTWDFVSTIVRQIPRGK